MSVKLNVKVDVSGMKSRFSSQRLAQAQALLVDRVAEDSNYHIPYDTGALHDTMQKNKDNVTWPQPYARYVYYGNNVKTVKNPNATAAWFETAKREHLGDWKRLVKDYLA